MSQSIFRVHPDDGVAVALRDIVAGELCSSAESINCTAQAAIAKGHKIALRHHDVGDPVLRYGQPIGRATQAIAPGEWVHVHNVATALSGAAGDAMLVGGQVLGGIASDRTWQGYARENGVGTRNEIWIFPTVGCVARTAQQVAMLAGERHRGRVDGVHAFTHPFGCSQLGDDLDGTRAILAGLAQHPNSGGVLLIGLGCESNQMATCLMPSHPPFVRASVA